MLQGLFNLERNVTYEWFITDSITTTRQTGLFHTLKLRCKETKYDAVIAFKLDPDTMRCPAMNLWIKSLFGESITPGQKPEEIFGLSYSFFASVYPRINSESAKQEMFWEIDVLSLAPTKQGESKQETIESVVKRVMGSTQTRTEKISTLAGYGKEYVALFRKLESQ